MKSKLINTASFLIILSLGVISVYLFVSFWNGYVETKRMLQEGIKKTEMQAVTIDSCKKEIAHRDQIISIHDTTAAQIIELCKKLKK